MRNSFSFISGSPRASRWAFIAIRRYLATVTPGIATGYWNAMKRPIRERSSGSASVTSSPMNEIEPSVTSKAGWPMIAFASVDLPEPFGPISAFTWPRETERSSPLRISLPSAVTCKLVISRSAMSPLVGSAGRRAWRAARERLSNGAVWASANSTSSARVVPASALVTPPCTRVQSSFVAHAWSPSVSCEQSTRLSPSASKHSIGEIGPSSAWTTSSILIFSAGFARR